MPLDIVTNYLFHKVVKYDIDIRGMKYETHRMFENTKYEK